jgi:hypothetical protein
MNIKIIRIIVLKQGSNKGKDSLIKKYHFPIIIKNINTKNKLQLMYLKKSNL